jgi:hypothetical protein
MGVDTIHHKTFVRNGDHTRFFRAKRAPQSAAFAALLASKPVPGEGLLRALIAQTMAAGWLGYRQQDRAISPDWPPDFIRIRMIPPVASPIGRVADSIANSRGQRSMTRFRSA